MRFAPACTPSQESTLQRDTAQRMAKALTPKQREHLLAAADPANKLGVVDLIAYGPGSGLRQRGWNRVMWKLRDDGLVRRYVHGGYEITDFGRRVAAELR